MGDQLRNSGQEFGSTTGRPRRCGWFDAVAMREAVRTSGITGLAITKLDVLNELPSIKICTAYSYKGELLDYFPRDLDVLKDCNPVYEEFDGWQSDITGIRSYEELPQQARAYLDKLSEVSECPLVLISVGPRRDQTIQLSNPFAG
jgi:adenylosuccinate synthase